MSTAVQRAKRREEVDRAYAEVAKAATWGAFRWGILGVSVVSLAHIASPTFKRQTLAFKGFLTTWFVCFGLVYNGEMTLQAREREVRRTEGRLRREARLDLARRGLIGTETEIAKWKEEREVRLREEQAQSQNAQPATVPSA